ncbi:VTT domain-containing protein [Microvirga sp. M2]|uniref:bifunctional DedA family/phosphatase PAP2 family protein n=1 Tax=Microvirga sp. M2 TaxID=3073270 RepID=UPI0039C33FAF
MPIDALTDFVAANPHLAYGAAFLLALSEAIPVIGAVVPGSALLIGIAALAPQGLIRVWPLLAAALLGAIAGDGLSYWLGHRYGEALLNRWPMNRHPDLVARSQAFMQRHGGKSVFLGRFTPGVRAFVPLLAGSLGMSPVRFYLANVLSAIVWAPAHVLPGVALGASVSAAGGHAGRLGVLLALVAVILWLVVWLTRATVRRGVPVLLSLRDQLWRWAAARDTWLARPVRALLDPAKPETGTLVLFAGLVLGAAWVFLGVLEDVVNGDPLVQLDLAVYNLIQGLRSPPTDAIMIAITELGDTFVVTLVTLIILAWFLLRRAWRAAIYWGLAVGIASLVNTGIKVLVHRARPAEDLYMGWGAFSFPSGHSTVNMALYGFLGFLIARELPPRWRIPAMATSLCLAAAIALSRLYLGAHWFSDVVGGLAFATVWTVTLGVTYVYHNPPSLNPKALASVACASVALVGGFNIARRHALDVERYAVREQVLTVSEAEWLGGAWRQRPAYRTDLTGEVEEPFTVQWAGDLGDVEQALQAKGWRRPVPWTLASALDWLAKTDDPLALPIVPVVATGRFPDLTLVHPGESPGTRVVLRLWPAEVQVGPEHARPLWIGSVVAERLSHPLSQITLIHQLPDVDRPWTILETAVPMMRTVHRNNPAGGWDGRVGLVPSGS